MTKHTKVFIVTINFGKPEHTIECLRSIADNNYRFFHVVIIDVSDIDHSVVKLGQWISENDSSKFTLIQEAENKGFAHANNIGVEYSLNQDDCEYLWVLNNDTVIEKDSVQQLLGFYKKHSETKNLGFVGSKIMDYKQKDLIQGVGGVFNKLTKFPDWIGAGEIDKGQFDEMTVVDHLLGASLFFHKSLVGGIGPMPEGYFLYFEDTDWCVKALRAGFQNAVCAKCIVYHKGGVSTGVDYLDDSKHLNNKRYFYTNLLKFYRLYFKWHLPFAYSFLLKKMAGKIYHKNYAEAKLISQVLFRFDKQK
jgi:GT2 family glycosyltransferase